MPIKNSLKYLMLFFLFFCVAPSFGQGPEKILTLKEALGLANKRSLDAFKAKRKYAIQYWQFRSYKARLLPKVDLLLEPFTYNRSFVERYDADRNIDVYRLQQTLNTFAQISISQNILLTGGTVFVNSSFNRLVNYGDNTLENYNTTPVRIGLIQPIMAHNELKWQKKTASLEFKRAKKAFIYDQQQINIKTVGMFFTWAMANARVEIALENRKNAKRLYEIGKKRYPLGSIEKDELLNLELDNFTSNTALAQAEQELKTVISDLKLFLNLEDISGYVPALPEMVSTLKISLQKAQQLMKRHNPELLATEIRQIMAESDLDQAIKENRFELSISASYGLNQQAYEFRNVYSNFLDQQIVAIHFSIPLLDWGERKGNIKTAKMTKEVTDIEIEQSINEIKRQLQLTVNNFNLQEEQVAAALKAKNISRESYEITERRFLSGKVDLLRLSSARRAWQTASEQYIQSLKDYWTYYYEVQQLTLYDFIQNTTLKENFDKLLEQQ